MCRAQATGLLFAFSGFEVVDKKAVTAVTKEAVKIMWTAESLLSIAYHVSSTAINKPAIMQVCCFLFMAIALGI